MAHEDLRVLVFGASLRQGSLNATLAELAARGRGGGRDRGPRVHARLRRSLVRRGRRGGGGDPDRIHELRRRSEANDAFIVASPECNGSVRGALKNAIEWMSRFRPRPFAGRHGLLLSASFSMAGGNRGLWALRVPFEHLGARIFPDMFSLAAAHRGLVDGRIADEALRGRFDKTVRAFLSLAEAAKHPCIKRAWVEFLGEPPEQGAERAQP